MSICCWRCLLNYFPRFTLSHWHLGLCCCWSLLWWPNTSKGNTALQPIYSRIYMSIFFARLLPRRMVTSIMKHVLSERCSSQAEANAAPRNVQRLLAIYWPPERFLIIVGSSLLNASLHYFMTPPIRAFLQKGLIIRNATINLLKRYHVALLVCSWSSFSPLPISGLSPWAAFILACSSSFAKPIFGFGSSRCALSPLTKPSSFR